MYSLLLRLVEAIRKVTEIQKKRQSTYVMQRLRKGREVEQHRDIREVQRDMALIRSPAAGKCILMTIVFPFFLRFKDGQY